MHKHAVCERTRKVIPIEKGYFVGNMRDGSWQFVSYEAPELMRDYPILGADLAANSASLVDWLAHLHEKVWFKPFKFFRFMHDFRRRTDLYWG